MAAILPIKDRKPNPEDLQCEKGTVLSPDEYEYATHIKVIVNAIAMSFFL